MTITVRLLKYSSNATKKSHPPNILLGSWCWKFSSSLSPLWPGWLRLGRGQVFRGAQPQRSRTEGYNCDIHRRSWGQLIWQIRDQTGMKVISNDADMICRVLNLNNTSTPSLSPLMNIGLVHMLPGPAMGDGAVSPNMSPGHDMWQWGAPPSDQLLGWCDDGAKMLGLIPHSP